MNLLSVILALVMDVIPSGDAFLNQLQKRDSVLVADQLEYGFSMDAVADGTRLELQDFSAASNDTLMLVSNWRIDTLSRNRRTGESDIRAAVVIAPFEEGRYVLPDILVRRTRGEVSDTLLFSHKELEVKTIPIDTATFQIHDLKPQIRYPVTVAEVVPYVLSFQFLATLVIAAVCLVMLRRRGQGSGPASNEPAYIVALRALDRYRGDKNWTPERQKGFYSGVTDTLKTYIEDRFSVDAPEMTTAELFASLKRNSDIGPDLYDETKDLFERADFVKFAKYVATDEENAKVLPLAVRFVTSTYQTQLEEEQKENVL